MSIDNFQTLNNNGFRSISIRVLFKMCQSFRIVVSIKCFFFFVLSLHSMLSYMILFKMKKKFKQLCYLQHYDMNIIIYLRDRKTFRTELC